MVSILNFARYDTAPDVDWSEIGWGCCIAFRIECGHNETEPTSQHTHCRLISCLAKGSEVRSGRHRRITTLGGILVIARFCRVSNSNSERTTITCRFHSKWDFGELLNCWPTSSGYSSISWWEPEVGHAIVVSCLYHKPLVARIRLNVILITAKINRIGDQL